MKKLEPRRYFRFEKCVDEPCIVVESRLVRSPPPLWLDARPRHGKAICPYIQLPE